MIKTLMDDKKTTSLRRMANNAQSNRKRIAVIGGGASGIAALKCFLDAGLDAVCYEKSEVFGGVWYFKETAMAGVPSVMRSTVANTSKEMTAFSDFPPPIEFPEFMPHPFILMYLQSYAHIFNLHSHIYLKHNVMLMSKSVDHELTGRWILTICNNGISQIEIFDGVAICTGLYTYPHAPFLPGLNFFQGLVVHSHIYKDSKGLEGKRVLIVGLGNSSGDIAVELSKCARSVIITVRRQVKVYPRVAQHGIPFDYTNSRWHHYVFQVMPKRMFTVVHDIKMGEMGPHMVGPCDVDNDKGNAPGILNDELINCVHAGTVVVHGQIDHFTKRGVYFQDAPGKEHYVDAVILATGYKLDFPFYPGCPFVNDNDIFLYKNVFPIGHCTHACLAIIGLFRVVGAAFPVSEMQARWVAQVFQNKVSLPHPRCMMRDMERQHRDGAELRSFIRYQSLVINFLPYMDEIAGFINVRPHLLCMAVSDPRLFRACYWGPLVPYQYRLYGPNAWPGARDAILDVCYRLQSRIRCAAGADQTYNVRRSDSSMLDVYCFTVASFALAAAVYALT